MSSKYPSRCQIDRNWKNICQILYELFDTYSFHENGTETFHAQANGIENDTGVEVLNKIYQKSGFIRQRDHESRLFTYDLSPIGAYSAHTRHGWKKTKINNSTSKAMMIIFFEIRGLSVFTGYPKVGSLINIIIWRFLLLPFAHKWEDEDPICRVLDASSRQFASPSRSICEGVIGVVGLGAPYLPGI